MKLRTVSPRPSQGASLWKVLVVLVVLLLLIVSGLGVFLYVTRSDKARLERKLAEVEAQRLKTDLEQKQALEDERRVSARNRQNEVLAQARKATNVLERLRAAARQVAGDAAALKTNEAGRTLALHPDLVAQARHLYDTDLRDLPTADEIINQLEAVRRIEQQVADKLGSAYEPEAEVVVTAQNAALWAEQALRKVGQVQALVAGLTQEARIKVTDQTLTAQSPTLDAAILQLNQAEQALRARIIQEQTQPAKTKAAEIEAKAEADRIAAQAQARADKLQQEIEIMKLETQRMQSNFQQQLALLRASNVVTVVQTTIAATNILDAAEKLKLKQEVSKPEVQVKLAPFTTPGYWFPRGKYSVDKKPHSFSQLNNVGALMPTDKGLVQLVLVASDVADKVRPRWPHYKGGAPAYLRRPKDLEQAREVQNLLIRYGPVLVELGQLQP